MKNLFLFVFIAVSLAANAVFAEIVATCNEIIEPNVNGAAEDTLLSAGPVNLVREQNGYFISYNWKNLKFEGHGSILALDTGCITEGSSYTYSKCVETKKVLKMKQSFSGGNEDKITAEFNKTNHRLRVTHSEQRVLFYRKLTDVVFQCE